MKPRKEHLRDLIKDFPLTPGVYLMKSQEGKVIYVGKAKALRQRVRSYFTDSNDHSAKTQFLVQSVQDIEFITTPTELDALLLEAQLIKKFRPRYNIRLKDDKSYPYIKISWQDQFPRFYLARKVKADGGIYFGPYPRGQVVAQTIQFLNETFKIRDCSDGILKSRTRPCLSYQIHKCTAPCVGLVSEEAYREQVRQARDFLQGKGAEVLEQIEKNMWQLAEQERFEEAARLRDSLQALKVTLSRQAAIERASQVDMDVVGYFGNEKGILFESYHLRKGQELGSRSYFFKITFEENEFRDHLVTFLTQYYEDNFIPDQLVLPIDLGNDLSQLLSRLLAQRSGKEVLVRFAGDQISQELLEKANRLAFTHFQSAVVKEENIEQGLQEIKDRFDLPKIPYRIDCFDISTFQGSETVASRVVFEDGIPAKHWYRRFKIRTVEGTDDYAAMREVLSRSYDDPSEELPDLIVIDGGKGQLNAALRVLKENHWNVPIVSLAKARTQGAFHEAQLVVSSERFFLPGRVNPVVFKTSSPAFRILVHLRDEAHRFAIQYHRHLREARSLETQSSPRKKAH